jgi:heparin/heparan-sulfate lyase
MTFLQFLMPALLLLAGQSASHVPSWLQDRKPIEGEFIVLKGHPRLYISAAELDTVRARTATTHRAEWESIQRARNSGDLVERMLANAFSFLVESDPNQARSAITAALELAARDLGGDEDLNMAYRVWPESVVYDWCYSQFSSEQRDTLLRLVRRQLEIAGGRILEQQPPHAGHLVNHLADAHIPAGIAFHDEDPSIFSRALAVARVQLAAKNIFYRDGGSSQGNSYGVTHANGDFRLLAQITKATGVDLFARFPFYRTLGYYWIYTRRPDGQLLRNGDDWLDDMKQNNRVRLQFQNLQVNVWTHPWLVELLLYAATRYSDPYLLGEYLKLRDTDRPWTCIEDIIWRDARLQPRDRESLDPIRYLGGAVGTLLFRTGWGTDDVVGMFKAMPLFAKNHDHLDRLSFQIYCRGALALDSGLYEGSRSFYDSDHWLNYLQRTIAHNGLLIRDPGERPVYRGKPAAADGGQFYPDEGANADTLEDIADPKWRIAEVLAAEVDRRMRYAFVSADATRGYGSKAEMVRRTFVFLRNSSGASFLIADRVISRVPEHEKVWLLHSMEEPEIREGVTIIRRTQGRNSGGVLMAQTLLPEKAVARIIGGPGREYWVDGVNYATEKGGDAEGGSWRVEVSSPAAEREVNFLHALQVFPKEPEKVQFATAVKGQGVTGAALPGWTVLVADGDREQPIVYGSGGTGYHLVLGLRPGRYVTVVANGRRIARVRTTDAGSAVFPWRQRRDSLVTVTLSDHNNSNQPRAAPGLGP